MALRHRHRRTWIQITILLGVLFIAPYVARADAPMTRGPQRMRAGSVTPRELWADVQPLPALGPMLSPAGGRLATPGAAPGQTFTLPAPLAQDGSGDESWVSRVLNPGNWIMDAGMGISTGLLATMSDIALTTVQHLIDAPSGCIGVIFCTPAETLFDSAGVISVSLATVWGRLIPVAAMLLTCFFVVRVGQIAMAGSHQFGTEGRNLVIMMTGALVMITQSGPFLRALVTFFNVMNSAILAADGSRLLQLIGSNPPLNFGVILTQLIFFLVFLCLLFVGYIRLFKLFLLFAVAPLMGALLLIPTQANYFKNWVNAILALLVEQTIWVVAFMIGITLAMPGGTIPDISDPANNAETIRHFVGATIAIIIALCSRSLLGGVFQAVAPAGTSFGMLRGLATWHLVRRTVGQSWNARGSRSTRGSHDAAGGKNKQPAGPNGAASGGNAGRTRRKAGAAAGTAAGAAGGGAAGAAGGGAVRGAIPAVAVAGHGNGAARAGGTDKGQIVPGTRARIALGQRGRELDPVPAATPTGQASAHGPAGAADSEQRGLAAPAVAPATSDRASARKWRRPVGPPSAAMRRRKARFGMAGRRAATMLQQEQPLAQHRRLSTAVSSHEEAMIARPGDGQQRTAISRRPRLGWRPGPNRPAATRTTMQQHLASEEPATMPSTTSRVHGDAQGAGRRYRPRTETVRMHRPPRVRLSNERMQAARQQPGDGSSRSTYAERVRAVQRAMLQRRSEQLSSEPRREDA